MLRALILLAGMTLFSAAQLGANEYRSIAVNSEPSGATVYLNGTIVGITPANVALSSGTGVSELEVSKDGFELFSHRFSELEIPDAIQVVLAPRRTIIPVTVADDLASAFDGEITLREALLYAAGDVRPVGLDRVLIDGPVGAGRADDIVISTKLHPLGPVLTIRKPLPPLSGPGDRLVGPQDRATIAIAHGFALRGAGLVMAPDTEAERLVLDGFDVGLSAEGFGTMAARDVSAIGGFVGFSASEGAELFLNGTDAINLSANASAHDGGLIDGFVEDISLDDLDNLTLYSGPPDGEDFTVLEGWTEPDGATNLFVRHAQTRPLREVADLVADTSSYDLYSIFGFGQSDQRWPRHVYDGIDGDFFRWAFKDAAAYEWMHVMGKRPMRTNKFVLHHLQVDAKLVKYSFSLLGRDHKVIETIEVETDGTVDEIAIDPEIDFFGFRINVVEAIGNSPGFTEIEAKILDSDAYEPLSVSRRRAIFARPHRGTRGIVEFNGELHPIGEAIFADRAPIAYSQADTAYRSRASASLTLPPSASVQDFRAALDEVSAAGGGEIVIPGLLDIDASLGEITLRGLRLTGGGEIHSNDGSALVFRNARDIRIDKLTLTGGGIDIGDTYPFVIEASTITLFDIAIIAADSRVVITNSSISDGILAYRGNATALTMTGSVIEDVAKGLSGRTADPLALVDNTITAREAALELRQETQNLGVLMFVANKADPAVPTDPVTAEYNFCQRRTKTTALAGEKVPQFDRHRFVHRPA